MLLHLKFHLFSQLCHLFNKLEFVFWVYLLAPEIIKDYFDV